MDEVLVRVLKPWNRYFPGDTCKISLVRAKEICNLEDPKAVIISADSTKKEPVIKEQVEKLVPVVFQKAYQRYNPGDVASFSSDKAVKLIKAEVAEYLALKAETKAISVKIVEEPEEVKDEKPIEKAVKKKKK